MRRWKRGSGALVVVCLAVLATGCSMRHPTFLSEAELAQAEVDSLGLDAFLELAPEQQAVRTERAEEALDPLTASEAMHRALVRQRENPLSYVPYLNYNTIPALGDVIEHLDELVPTRDEALPCGLCLHHPEWHQGVIGIALYNPFLRANHHMGDPKELVTLDHVIAHIDHICQILGDATHVGLGTDMDGGFGADDIPTPIDSVADIPLLIDPLKNYGYEEKDIARIMGGNWLTLLRASLPP